MVCKPANRRAHRGVQDRRAAVTVELAVTLPILLILLLGSIDAGQFASAYQVVSDASRESARMAARADTDSTATVQTTVQNYLQNAFPTANLAESVTVRVLTEDGGTVSGSLADVAEGTPIEVEVSLDFDAVRVIPGISQLDNRTIQMSTVMCRQ